MTTPRRSRPRRGQTIKFRRPAMNYQATIDQIKVALNAAETEYNLAYAAGNLNEAMLHKRKVSEYRREVGRLIKQKLRSR